MKIIFTSLLILLFNNIHCFAQWVELDLGMEVDHLSDYLLYNTENRHCGGWEL